MDANDFRNVRTQLGLTQAEMAIKLGVSTSTVGNAERGLSVHKSYERGVATLMATFTSSEPSVAVTALDDSSTALIEYRKAVAAITALFHIVSRQAVIDQRAAAPAKLPAPRYQRMTAQQLAERAAERKVLEPILVAKYQRRADLEQLQQRLGALVAQRSWEPYLAAVADAKRNPAPHIQAYLKSLVDYQPHTPTEAEIDAV